MRVLVLSDSHGAADLVRRAVAQQPSASLILHLGDGERDMLGCGASVPILQVRGNCDWGSDLPAKIVTQECGCTLYLTHGYAERVKYGLYELKAAAREHHAHIALYGHTHEPVTTYEDGLWLVNPGSVRQGSYAVLDLTEKGVMPILMKIR